MNGKPSPNTAKLNEYTKGVLPLGGAKSWENVSILYGVVNIVEKYHWVAVCINLKQRKICIYDSKKPRHTGNTVKAYAEIQRIANYLKANVIDGDWHIEFIEDCPQQPEG